MPFEPFELLSVYRGEEDRGYLPTSTGREKRLIMAGPQVEPGPSTDEFEYADYRGWRNQDIGH